MNQPARHSRPSTPPATPPLTPPANAGMDALIGSIQQQREQNPLQPLDELIGGTALAPEALAPEALVELAALDLIAQRRRGHDVVVEDYVKQFPQFAGSESALLDLIDAEICIRVECDDARDAEFYADRFPDLAEPIRQLVHLEHPPSRPSELQSREFVVERHQTIADHHRRPDHAVVESRREDSIDVPIPIKPPQWIVGAKCIATARSETGRYWLVSGRDTQRHDAIAMKILPLPTLLDSTGRTRILDLCEQTSNIVHPSWIPPRIAAINNGHLAVVRPWIYGTTLASCDRRSETDPMQSLQRLVRVAYALTAAHRVGATHGSVKSENIVIDHQSHVNLIDAACGVAGWQRYLAIWDNDLLKTLPERIRQDSYGLLETIARRCITARKPELLEWLQVLATGVNFSDADACATIGDRLQSLLDQQPGKQMPNRHPPNKRSWWR